MIIIVFICLIKENCSSDILISSSKIYKANQFTDNERGDIHFLDRQHVKCDDGEALNSFRLENGSQQIRYVYNCIKSDSISNNCQNRETVINDNAKDNKKSLIFLDRHNVECDQDEVLKEFKLDRKDRKINYKYIWYICCNASIKDKKDFDTNRTPQGDGKIQNLKNQEVNAGNSNSGINKFKLNTDHQGGKIYYSVTAFTLKYNIYN